MEIITYDRIDEISNATLREYTQRIYANVNTVRCSLVQVCRDLAEIKNNRLYEKDFGNGFSYYCEHFLGISKSKAYRLIGLAEKIFAPAVENNVLTKYAELRESSLVELLPLGNFIEVDEVVTNWSITPESTKEDVKKAVKEYLGEIPCEAEEKSEVEESAEEIENPVENSVENVEIGYLKEVAAMLASDIVGACELFPEYKSLIKDIVKTYSE